MQASAQEYVVIGIPRSLRLLTNEEADRLEDSAGRSRACPTCNGRGRFRWWDDPRSPTNPVEWACRCPDQITMSRCFRWAGLGLGHQRLGVYDVGERLLEHEAFGAVTSYLEDPAYFRQAGCGMLFSGLVGNGKSMLAILMLKTLLAEGFSGYFGHFPDLLDQYRSTWRSAEERQYYQRHIRNVDFLVIDDVGKESTIGGVEQRAVASTVFDTLVRHRLAHALPTIITTNLSMDDFAMRYGEGLVSLIREYTVPNRFEADDFRPDQNLRAQAEFRAKLVRPIVVG